MVISPFLLLSTICFIVGIYLTIVSFDEFLLSKGLKPLVPKWLNHILEERDLFELLVDFLRANNPIMIFFRLAALKIFDLNRDEAVVLMGGISPPFAKRWKRRTFISFWPDFLRKRYNPKDSSMSLERTFLGASTNSFQSMPTNSISSLSSIILKLLESRIKQGLMGLNPYMSRLALQLSLVAFIYSLLQRTAFYRKTVSKLPISTFLYLFVIVYVLNSQKSILDSVLRPGDIKKLNRVTYSPNHHSSKMLEKQVLFSSLDKPLTTNYSKLSEKASSDHSQAYWELHLCHFT